MSDVQLKKLLGMKSRRKIQPKMRSEISQSAGPEISARIEERGNKRVTMMAFHRLIKLKERIHTISRDMENILKDSN